MPVGAALLAGILGVAKTQIEKLFNSRLRFAVMQPQKSHFSPRLLPALHP